MATISYDREADEQWQIIRRVEHALTRMKDDVDVLWDRDVLGFQVWADSEPILRQFHQVGFPTFEFPGVEPDGHRFRTHFRLR